MIRVLIVDDNPVIRRGVAALLSGLDDIRIVGEAGDGREAVAMAGRVSPDVVLLDIRMPVMGGVAAAEKLSERSRVMMLTYTDESEQVVAAIRNGASGYLVHGQFEADELADRIRQLASGETVLSPAVVGTVFEALRRPPGSPDEASGPASLTSREREVMNLISQGLTNQQIAAHFVLSEKTVKNHVNRIYAKLGASNRAHATALWLGTASRDDVA
jgi:DNA-binding NarL/FixJ family response regulator